MSKLTPSSSVLMEIARNPHLHLIAQSLPVVFFTLDQEGRFLMVKGRGCVQMGLDAMQTQGRRCDDVFYDEPGLIARLKQMRFSATQGHWTAEVRSHIWEFYTMPLPDDSERQPTGITGIALNVTQQRHTEGEVRWRNREITALNSITAALTSTLDFSEVLMTLKHQVAAHLNILGGAVYLRDNTDIALYTAWGVPPGVIARTSALVVSSGFWHNDPRTNARLLEDIFADSPKEMQPWQCAISIPLIYSQQSLGVLVLYGVELLTFSKHRPVFLEMLGHQVGVALQNARMFHKVSEGREELQHLTHRLVSVQEAERTRIARELHDEFGQILTCMKLSLEIVEASNLSPDKAAFELVQAKSLVDDMLAHVRDLTLELRTTVLDDMGLVAALYWYTERFMAQTNIVVHFDHDERTHGRRFTEPIETAAYRVVQEALTNVARHANVEQVRVMLFIVEQESSCCSVRIVVEDSGQGFNMNETGRPASNGLVGMRERVIALGGVFRLQSAPGRGTRIELLLPVEGSI